MERNEERVAVVDGSDSVRAPQVLSTPASYLWGIKIFESAATVFFDTGRDRGVWWSSKKSG
jgi:hypothetical protein